MITSPRFFFRCSKVVSTAIVAAVVAWFAHGGVAAEKKILFIDLQPKSNQKLADDFHGTPGNNLAEVPQGEQTFEGVKFKVDAGLIQLGGKLLPDNPMKVDGIKVDKIFTKLHLLHGTGWGAPGMEGDPMFVPDDTLIGQYTVNYEDKTAEIIPIVYGNDVRDWWNWDKSKPTTRAKVAWEGYNEASKQNNVMIRIFSGTWENPKPDKKVASIEYSSANTVAAPFCIAMTIEEK